MSNIEEIIRILGEEGDYRRAPHRLQMSGLEFPLDFNAVLVGPGEGSQIVLLLDTSEVSPDVALRRLKTLARILERTSSKRTITLVIFTDEADHPTIKEMEALCRVVICPTRQDLRKALRTLLPLKLPEPFRRMDSAFEAVKAELGIETRDPIVDKVLKAAKEGSEQIRRTVQKAIEEKARVAVKS